MPCTALSYYEDKHGKDCEFLSKNAIIEFAELFARKFYAQKLTEINSINDTYVEKNRHYPKQPPIQDIP